MVRLEYKGQAVYQSGSFGVVTRAPSLLNKFQHPDYKSDFVCHFDNNATTEFYNIKQSPSSCRDKYEDGLMVYFTKPMPTYDLPFDAFEITGFRLCGAAVRYGQMFLGRFLPIETMFAMEAERCDLNHYLLFHILTKLKIMEP